MKTLLLLITTIIFVSCSSQSSKTHQNNLDKGKLEGNLYSNNNFGFELKVNTPWQILNLKELMQTINERLDLINKDEGRVDTITQAAEILLSLTIDTIETMPHVIISSLDLTRTPLVKNETDYLNDYARQIKKTYQNYDVQFSKSEIRQEKLAGKNFYEIIFTIKAANYVGTHKRYSRKEGDKLLNLMTNSNSDYWEKKCQNLLDNIKWK